MLPSAAWTLETDQYWAWGRPLADSTAAVNAKFNLELERTLASFPEDKPPTSCRKVAAAYRARMRFVLLHDIQVWAWNTRFVDRVPDGGEEYAEYRRTNLYSNHSWIDTGTWMPFTPTIEVAGVRFGTDKLAHFVSSGWTYYDEYRKAVEAGETTIAAERAAVGRGMLEERLVLGGATSGVEAIADLEASYAGMHFYRDLCGGEDPILLLGELGWRISRPVDLQNYVTPRWDESYQPPVYSDSRWRKVRPVLEQYCDRLDDPQVIELRRRYRALDHGSVVGEMVAERVARGQLADPARFGIEAACSRPDPSRDPAPRATDRAEYSRAGTPRAMNVDEIAAEEVDRRRRALGLPGLRISYPLLLSASLAVMPTAQPRGWDCTTPCDFRGPFIELEPGLGGVSLSAGWARVTGNTNRKGTLMKAAFIGAAYKLTVLRTWGDAGWVEGDRTYAGFELGVPVAQANVGIGLLYRVDDGDKGRWMVTGGAGWGF